MPVKAKLYLSAVFAGAAAVLVTATWNSIWPGPLAYGLFLSAALLCSVVKLRLPGLNGVYSFNFLVLLFGLLEFDAAPVLLTGAFCGLAQSLLNVKKRPQPIQIVFNVANLVLSLGACALVGRVLLEHQVIFRPAVLALIAALYFVINTGLVSGILSLAQGQSLAAVSEEWYFWAFPYFLLGAACLGFLPSAGGRIAGGEMWLIIVPLLYLLHFFYGLSTGRRPAMLTASEGSRESQLPGAAKAFVGIVTTLGSLLVAFGVAHWVCQVPLRFVAVAVVALMASTQKVRLPGMAGTISLNFIVLLVAVLEMSLGETLVLCAATGAMQSLWKPARRPGVHQVAFNMSALVLSGSLAYLICGWAAVSLPSLSLWFLLPLAVIVMYSANSLLVSAVICLAQQQPLRRVWQYCYFWSLPYYLVGGAGSGMIIATLRASGWGYSLLVIPLIVLVYVSYRAHISVAAQQMATA